MLRHWLRTRRALHDLLDDADAENAELAVELDDLGEKNLALTRQLDAARVEADAVKADRDTHRHDLANMRAELAVLKSGLALDQPFS